MHSAEGIALTLLALSEAHRLQADYARALPYLQDSLAMYRELDHPAGIAVCLQNMADIHQAEGRYALAAAGCAESLNVLYPVTQEEPELVSAGLHDGPGPARR
jgi:tetratricopeptide (TPR) repeat protein